MLHVPIPTAAHSIENVKKTSSPLVTVPRALKDDVKGPHLGEAVSSQTNPSVPLAGLEISNDRSAALSGPVVDAVIPLSESVIIPLPTGPVIVPETIQLLPPFTEFERPNGSFEFALTCAVPAISSTLAEAFPEPVK